MLCFSLRCFKCLLSTSFGCFWIFVSAYPTDPGFLAVLDFDSTNYISPWLLASRTTDFTFFPMENQRCVNCAITLRRGLNRERRHSLDSSEIQSVIRGWIAPRPVTESDYVCHSCWLLARQSLAQPLIPHVGHRHICINCGRSLLRTRFHALAYDSNRDRHIHDVISSWIFPQQISPTSSICHPCWQRANRAQPPMRRQSNSAEPDNALPEVEAPHEEAVITLPDYARSSVTQSHCFVAHCQNQERYAIPIALRQLLLREYQYYVPANNRVCSFHLIRNDWSFLNNQENRSNHLFTATYIQDMMTVLKAVPELIDFENIDLLPNHLFFYWLGRSKEEFSRILAEVPRLREVGATALAAYLIKIRTGDSFDRISTLMKKPKRSVINLVKQAREILVQDYVPLHLGFNHISREQIAQRNLLIPNGLFGNNSNAIVIMDGTYIYVQKSSNYLFQKNTYSLHKYRNLIKVFLIVSTDGYIIEVLGPYPATTSDADILKNEFRNQPLQTYFQENDVFILDRGFRNVLPFLTNNGYRPYMPATVQEGETQLSTLNANQSRAVTICRWVVEVINGRFKRDYKIFRQEYYNTASRSLMSDFSIAAALINAFHPLLRDRDDAGDILQLIHEKMNVENSLAEVVLRNNLNRRRTNFVQINVENNNVNDFPQLTYSELILVCLGTYHIKQARSYYGEHVRANGSYIIEVCREVNSSLLRELSNTNAWILRGKIQSRHISRKVYYVYILIDSSLRGRNAIIQHYCNCIVGRRTVGCCAHIMSIIWYLGWARFQNNLAPPAPHLDSMFSHNEGNVVVGD